MTQTINQSQTTALPSRNPFTVTLTFPDLTGEQVQETLCVPGVIVQEAEQPFVEGYSWGRSCYFDDVDETVNADATPHTGESTIDEWISGAVRSQKVRDISTTNLVDFIKDVLAQSRFPKADQIGAIVGYVVACTQQYYGLLCPTCGASSGDCTHPGPVPAIKVSSFLHIAPRYVGSDGFPLDL